MKLKTYAILIPARLNSRRIPNKNFRDFCGKPLIYWTIKFAKELEYPIYISTDNEEQFDFYEDCTFIKRPSVLGRDDTPLEEVIKHARSHIKEDYIIMLQPTSPLRFKNSVERMISLHEREKYPGLVTVNQFTFKPDGYLYIMPKDKWIWDIESIVCRIPPQWDIDYIWDFKIAEAECRKQWNL